ncbi:MAG: hypothetical protein GY750_10765 [Lentisphaerae bacterium]|nr:hypothetical protein [Lentisphaerota bacterium]MCP4101892.1 hypothetical protein [Lentisphaerota bacterium]
MTDLRDGPIRVQAKGFSWSTARERHYEFCPRAYFYQYYATSGGFEKYSAARQLYRLKHLKTVPFWLKSLLGECIRDWFYDAASDVPIERILRRLFSWRFRKGIKSLSLQEWREDSKKLNLFEHYYDHKDLGDLLEEVTDSLTRSINNLFSSGLISQLEKVIQVDKIIFNPPLETNLGNLKIWFAPDLIWRESGKVNFLNILIEEKNELNADSIMLHRLYAMNQLKISPENVQSFGFLPSTGLYYLFDENSLNISKCIDKVTQSSSKLFELHSASEELQEENFYKKSGKCNSCRFQEFCKNRNI